MARSILRRCPSRNAEVFEVLLRQITHNRKVNGETLGVLSHSERCQPLGNIFQGNLSRSHNKISALP